MPARAFNYLSHHAIAIIALTCSLLALAGAGYAALVLPNHSITPVKLNPRYIGGYVRAWASVTANGHITASSGGVRVLVDRFIGPGHYIINWHPRPTSSCEATGNVDLRGDGGPPVPGYVSAQTGASRGRGEQSVVQTYNSQGQPTALAFNVQLVCSTPH